MTSSADRSGAAAARVVSTDAAGLPALDLERIARVLERILRDHGKAGCLSLAWVDDAAMRALHRDFLADDTPTDVLSFALADEDDSSSAGRGRTDAGDGPPRAEDPFGEVVVSVETAIREAACRRIAPEREAALYAIHGALHLVGYDDRGDDDRREMRRQERRYLRLFDGARAQKQKKPGALE